ncbi:copper resistance protein CopC [Demequina sp. SYSU T00192]|uniref:Copper resistance protein CopC n=1 Tax=Demequina litoralis TaxID=3051660 RepID=A0ABT8GB23_9MICO|nr:copper resistance protein CopC [Demequina sp. SYSU T00192]MDN4476342.1 copper resistance protein CopC [Demequina sp. SYSU T00192]
MLIFVLALAFALVNGHTAWAHTDLDHSDPADGVTVDHAVEEIVLTFTLPVTPLGEAVEIAGPDGPVEAAIEQTDDGIVIVATPAEPLGDGAYTVAWTVAAEDGHPLDGTFSFDVAGVAPEPTHTATASATPDATASASPSSTEQQSASPSPTATMAMDPESAGGAASDLAARIVARGGAAIALWSLLVAGGALAFAGIAMRGRDSDDVPRLLAGVRWCGALLLGGLALRVIGRSALIAGGSFADGLQADAFQDALAGTFAWVLGLQALGGLLMLVGTMRTVAGSWLATVGVLVAGAGHVLGGHSNTAEPRWLVLTADIAHLVAAAVWVGGVVSLAAVLRRRSREGRPLDAGAMASRFGVVAAASFVVVGIAGVVLAWEILEELSDLWTSTWGIVLLVKVALVAVVAVIGAYTHFRIVPRLAARSGEGEHDAPEDAHLRGVVRWESALFVAVVVATAVLVASSVHA